MSEQELNKFERALDAGAIVALGKLVLFKLAWEELKFRASTKNPSEKDLASARITIRQVISQLSDETFFLPPAMISSVENIEEYFKTKFRKERLVEQVLAEYDRVLRKGTPSLAEYSNDS